MKKFTIYVCISLSLFMGMYNLVESKDIADGMKNQIFLEISTTLDVIQDLQRSVEEYLPCDDYKAEIMSILVETYERIISIMILSYITHPSLHIDMNVSYEISYIVGSNLVRIINILMKRLLYYLHDKKISWKEKTLHCVGIIGVFGLVKISMSYIQILHGVDKKEKSCDANNSYIEGKFGKYRNILFNRV